LNCLRQFLCRLFAYFLLPPLPSHSVPPPLFSNSIPPSLFPRWFLARNTHFHISLLFLLCAPVVSPSLRDAGWRPPPLKTFQAHALSLIKKRLAEFFPVWRRPPLLFLRRATRRAAFFLPPIERFRVCECAYTGDFVLVFPDLPDQVFSSVPFSRTSRTPLKDFCLHAFSPFS